MSFIGKKKLISEVNTKLSEDKRIMYNFFSAIDTEEFQSGFRFIFRLICRFDFFSLSKLFSYTIFQIFPTLIDCYIVYFFLMVLIVLLLVCGVEVCKCSKCPDAFVFAGEGGGEDRWSFYIFYSFQRFDCTLTLIERN